MFDEERIAGLACMTELPCPYQKDINGICWCMKNEGGCEYQIVEDTGSSGEVTG